MSLILVPHQSVGPFRFGVQIAEYLESWPLVFFGRGDSSGYDSYLLDSIGVSLYTEEGRLEAVFCEKECVYRGRNVIGMAFQDFETHANVIAVETPGIYEFEADDVNQKVYEYDAIGLQVWTKHGCVVAVIASDSQ